MSFEGNCKGCTGVPQGFLQSSGSGLIVLGSGFGGAGFGAYASVSFVKLGVLFGGRKLPTLNSKPYLDPKKPTFLGRVPYYDFLI